MEDKINDAVEKALLARTNHFNCAQSVLLGWKDVYPVTDQKITDAKACGGGRAPGGLCGALWAALELVPDPEKQERIKNGFFNAAKSLYCNEIKGNTVPCNECVKIAVELVGSIDRK